MNPHLHIIIIWSPWFTLRFTLDVVRTVHSIGCNMYPMLNFFVLNIPSSPPVYSLSPRPPHPWPQHACNAEVWLSLLLQLERSDSTYSHGSLLYFL